MYFFVKITSKKMQNCIYMLFKHNIREARKQYTMIDERGGKSMKKQVSRISKYLLTLVLALVMVLGAGKAMEVKAAEGDDVTDSLPFSFYVLDSEGNKTGEKLKVVETGENRNCSSTKTATLYKVTAPAKTTKVYVEAGDTVYCWYGKSWSALPEHTDDDGHANGAWVDVTKYSSYQYNAPGYQTYYYTVEFELLPDPDQIAADEVSELIGLIDLDSINEEKITSAAEAFDALNEVQKALVSDENKDLLNKAKNILNVIKKIDAIGNVTLDSKNAIDEARAAYEVLDEDGEKPYIDDGILKTLTDAETKYAKLEKAAAEKTAADKAAAEKKAAEEKAAAEKKAAEEAAAAAAKKAATPAKVKSLKVKKASSKKVTISWKKVKGCSGYEVVMRTGKKGSFKVIKTVKSAKKVTISKAGLKKNKSYTFKVRAYTTLNGEKVYGAYSAAKTVKMK